MVGHLYICPSSWGHVSRAEKSKLQTISLRVISVQVAIESIHKNGSLGDSREDHVWRRAES